MLLSIGKDELQNYLVKQINTFIPDGKEVDRGVIQKYFNLILQRVEYCFSKVNNKYFSNGNEVLFNHLNGDQYAMFLYFASNTLHRNNADSTLCTKIFLLNKYLHGIDVFYEVDLPDIFLFVHPLGTVLGKGKYSNYFLVYQRCNVGSNRDIYPTMGEHVGLHPGSSILGRCNVGNNCKVSAGSLLMDMDLDDHSLYIGIPKEYVVKSSISYNTIWKKG